MEVVPIVLKVILNVNDEPVSPVSLNERSRELIVEHHHRAQNTVGRQFNAIDREPILEISRTFIGKSYFAGFSGVGSILVVVSVDIVISPALPVRSTVGAG